jgi:hypothetical protein
MLSLLALAAAAVAVPNGRMLNVGGSCFAIKMKSGDAERVIGNALQTVRRRKIAGVDALEIVIRQRLSDGKFDLRDKLLVRRDDLRPIRLTSMRNGTPNAYLEYSDANVSGWKLEKGVRKPIAVKLSHPIWDGNLWGLTFASLPLREGGSYALPIYHYDKGFGEFTVNVKGKEPVRVGQKSVSAWILDAGVATDRRSKYHVSDAREELGYSAGPMSQTLGGDCSALRNSPPPPRR